MAETKFTLGPWRTSFSHPFLVLTNGGLLLAKAMRGELGAPPRSMVETSANAQLIKSAPALYAALECLEREARALHDYCDARFTESEMEMDAGLGEPMAGVHVCVHEARAALSQARGEDQ
jgi:hypothetical protein